MRAVIINAFGGPEQMLLTDVPTPEPQAHEVQIKVAYAGVNPVDWKIREGLLKDRLPHEFPIILGWEAAGTVSKTGREVSNLWVGDPVFAYVRKPIVKWGSFAEYVCFDAKHVVHKPSRLTPKEAAAIPLNALTAWQCLTEAAPIKIGETLLVHAGAGGVGGMAIQFAKHLGARVFTTASTHHHHYVQQLGADFAIDYRKEDFVSRVKELSPGGVDAVLDCVGGETLQKSFNALKPGGRLVSIVQQVDPAEAMKHGIIPGYVFVRPDGEQLKIISGLLDSGSVQTPAITEFSIQEAAAALEKVKESHTAGKIVLRMVGK